MEKKLPPLMSDDHDLITNNIRDGFLQYCPFDRRCHPQQTSLEKQSREWTTGLFKAYGLPRAQLQSLLDMNYAALSCMMYPNGRSEARSFTLVKLLHWILLLDDLFDESHHAIGLDLASARVFCSRQLMSMFGPSGVAAAGLTDIVLENFRNESKGIPNDHQLSQQQLVIEMGVQWSRDMQAQGMSSKQLKRVQEMVVDYLTGVLRIVALREQNKLPTVQEYIPLRRKEGAARICLLGCEFDRNMELDDEALAQPLIEDLHQAIADQVLWINDVVSFNSEYHKGDYINLITILHYHNNQMVYHPTHKIMDFKEALSQACAMIHGRDKDGIRISHEINVWRPYLQSYVEAIHYILFGTTAWTLGSLRYKLKCSHDLTN